MFPDPKSPVGACNTTKSQENIFQFFDGEPWSRDPDNPSLQSTNADKSRPIHSLLIEQKPAADDYGMRGARDQGWGGGRDQVRGGGPGRGVAEIKAQTLRNKSPPATVEEEKRLYAEYKSKEGIE